MPQSPKGDVRLPEVLGAGLEEALDIQKANFDALIGTRTKLAAIKVPPGNALTNLYVQGVHSAITHLIEAAVEVAKQHDIALSERTTLRSVKDATI